jgi:hypothetical protein
MITLWRQLDRALAVRMIGLRCDSSRRVGHHGQKGALLVQSFGKQFASHHFATTAIAAATGAFLKLRKGAHAFIAYCAANIRFGDRVAQTYVHEQNHPLKESLTWSF